MTFDLHIRSKTYELPSTSIRLDQRGAFPSSGGIYFVLSESEQILYVGKSTNLRNRLCGEHLRRFEEESSRIAWLPVNDNSLLSKVEAEMIAHFNPPLNKNLVPKTVKKATFQIDEEVIRQFEVFYLTLRLKLGKNAPYGGVIVEEAIARLLASSDQAELLAALEARQKRRQ